MRQTQRQGSGPLWAVGTWAQTHIGMSGRQGEQEVPVQGTGAEGSAALWTATHRNSQRERREF